MLFTLLTNKTVSEAGAALERAVQANHLGVLHVHNMKATLAQKGLALAHECLIVEVCQPQQAKTVLEHDMSVSTALPCRISVYEDGGKTFLSTLKPTALLAMFHLPQLTTVAQELEVTIVKAMEEAVL